MSNLGNLTVKPVEGKFYKNYDWFGKMDPYVVIQLGSQVKRSATHWKGGKHPRWTDTIHFRRRDETELRVESWDADRSSADDRIGEGTLPLTAALNSGYWTGKVDIVKRNKKRGEVTLEILWEPDNRPLSQPTYSFSRPKSSAHTM